MSKYVDYYFHKKTIRCTRPGVDFFVDDETHPVVFVGGHGKGRIGGEDIGVKIGKGEGSHGSYPVKGFWDDVAAIKLSGDITLNHIDEYIDGNGEFLSYKGFNVKLLPHSINEIVYGKDFDLYWMRSNILWGHRDVKSPGDWLEPIKKEIGNSPPRSPHFRAAWNTTGSDAEFKNYTKTPPSLIASGYKIPDVGVITGRVIDKQTNLPIAGATIKVVGRNRSATTDKDGRYKLALPVGKYK